MSSNVNIKYVNHSMNLDQPSVFVFTKNEIPSFDALRETGGFMCSANAWILSLIHI